MIIWRYGITVWGANFTDLDQHIGKHWMKVDGAEHAPAALKEAIENWLRKGGNESTHSK
jgi:hypothetical protein